MTDTQIARIIRQAAEDAIFNGAGKIINPEIFMEAAYKIRVALSAGQREEQK